MDWKGLLINWSWTDILAIVTALVIMGLLNKYIIKYTDKFNQFLAKRKEKREKLKSKNN